MKMLDIVKYPDSRLKQKSEEIFEITEEIIDLASDMIFTMIRGNGVGIAAPQVGENIRMICVLVTEGWNRYTLTMINPVIEKFEGTPIHNEEGCLSCPGVMKDIERFPIIDVTYTGIDGQQATLHASKFTARIIQHEIDHLNGILII
jgi:peptide deformylase